jgi:3'-5' exoribonuclease
MKTLSEKFTIDRLEAKKHHLELILDNQGTKMLGIVRDNIDLCLTSFNPGDVVVCKGKLRRMKKQQYLEIGVIQKSLTSVPTEEVQTKADHSKIDLRSYIRRFDELIELVHDTDYKEILKAVFNEDVRLMFFTYPGGREKHHAYKHGLLQHSLETAEVAKMLGEYYGNVNLDLLVTGALLHDIGKLKAYESNDASEEFLGQINRTSWDSLLGHLAMSAIFVSKVIPASVDSNKAMMLYHLILSHHGKEEWGSPIKSKMFESVILHKADVLSYIFDRLNNLVYDKNGWSNYDELSKIQWFKSDVI